jgi:hypothetical protein
MPCRFSTPLTDEQLLAVMDDEADATTERHLSNCPGCSTRLTQLRKLLGGMKNTLLRFDCPSPDQLTDYHLHLNQPTEASVIAEHLEICASCREEIAMLESLLNVDDATPVQENLPASRMPRLRERVAALLPRSLDPAFALRGEETNKITVQTDGVTIFLEVESLPQGFTLTGQLMDVDQDRWAGALVKVESNGSFIMTTRLDDEGEFQCAALPGGKAALRITDQTGYTIVVNDIALNP